MYNTLSLDEQSYIVEYLLDEGYASSLTSAENIMLSMSEDWLFDILDEEYRNLARKSGKMTQRAAALGLKSGAARIAADYLERGGIRNAIRMRLGLPPKVRPNERSRKLREVSKDAAHKASVIAAVSGTHLPGLSQYAEVLNRHKGVEKLRNQLERTYDK